MSDEVLGSAQLDEAVSWVRERAPQAPKIGLVLGSGLGGFADTLTNRIALPYKDIPHMPVSRVVGHAGNLVLGQVEGVPVVCQQGRVHLYEGHHPSRVVFGARLLARLGASVVLLTNAAGGIRRTFQAGDLMLLSDHLNLVGRNPLVGANDDALGPRFPPMGEAYSRRLRKLAVAAAVRSNVRLHEGVYAALLGPSYETPAEIHMLRTLGADAVGMSTAPETIALRHMGVEVGAISCITNLAADLSPVELDHSEVEATAKQTRSAFVGLLTAWIADIGVEA